MVWLLTLASIGVAQAESLETAPSFSWHAPDACPRQEFVLTELERFLGHPFEQGSSAERAFSVDVDQLPNRGFRARLVMTAGAESGERTVDHDDCVQLAKVVALVVALTLDPAAVRQTQETAASGLEAPRQDAAPAPCRCNCPVDDGMWHRLLDTTSPCPALACPSPQPCRPCVYPPRTWQPPPSDLRRPTVVRPFAWYLEAGVGAATGVLPELGPTVTADAGLEIRERWRLELGGRYWIRQEFSPADHASVRTSVRMFSGGARFCGLPFASGWRLAACLGPELGDYRAASLAGATPGKVEHGRWLALLGGLGAYFPLGFGLELGTRIEGGPVVERPALGAVTESGEWVNLTEAKAFVASFGATLLFEDRGAD